MWKVVRVFVGGSHHWPIIIDLPNVASKPVPFVQKRKLNSALARIHCNEGVDGICEAINKEIKGATIDLNSVKGSLKAWWNESLKKQFRLLSACRKKARLTNNVRDFEELLNMEEEWKAAVKKAKADCYRARISELNEYPNTTDAWRFVNSVKGTRKSVPFWPSDEQAQYLDLLKNQCAVRTVEVGRDCQVSDNGCMDDSGLEFSVEVFDSVLRKKKKSAGGLDGVTFGMLKGLPVDTKEALVHDFERHFLENRVREEWRKIKIVPIPKHGKDLNDIQNFRPISLLSVFVKSINMIIKEELMEWAEKNNVFPDGCFAYRKGKSATMCLNEFIYWSSKFKKCRKKVFVCVLDISDAYNCVSIDKLDYRLLITSTASSTVIARTTAIPAVFPLGKCT
ncbi:PREDICTED: uncharacterized protein LOC108377329 [Rhagoletis zephyria]|uniref:uncharacterized protein LOC108377329 n=1 Tax=Rhagoletis zephyria TaxID=28612 RepID=UPI0008115E10|nr:PREDICTED: uncharacterized protein LOC108377329 [Rhagoletis zephyria]